MCYPSPSVIKQRFLDGRSTVLARVWALTGVLLAGVAQAQSTVDAGRLEPNDAQQLQRQQERENALRRVEEKPRDKTPSAAPAAPRLHLPQAEEPCFVIQRLALDELAVGQGTEASALAPALAHASPDAGARVDGITLQQPANRFSFLLEAAAGPDGDDSPIGRCIGAEGIDVLTSRLQEAAVRSGYVSTQIKLGPQALNDGALTFTVVPGVLRRIRFTADSSDRATAWNAFSIEPGQILQLRDIEQGLDNLKRVPTAEADFVVTPVGREGAPGESDVVVRYTQRFPIRVQLSVDDGGTASTGKVQGTTTVSYDNALTLNDLFYVSVGHDLGAGGGGADDGKGTRNATAHYSVPFGWWLFNATASSNRYHQSVAGVSQTYVYAGRSETEEFRVSRVVWRDARGKTTLALRGFRRASSNFIDDTEVEVQRRVTAGWEASVAHRQYLGEAVVDANLALRRGTGAFGAIGAPEEAFGEGTSRMQVATADLGLSQPVDVAGTRFRLASNWHGQWNRTPLSPQDRLSIGGRYSVRGFDGESSLLAERGWFWRNEFGLPVCGQEVYLGVDAGRVGGASASSLLGRSLAGAVVGLRGIWQGLSYDVFAGAPLYKPDGFRTAGTTVGFSASYSF
ncbi:MAG: hypothetical protein JWQ11_1945 [Rhizobacter sp.]|nr:hypothetical protein [Rhizobacter sp.]